MPKITKNGAEMGAEINDFDFFLLRKRLKLTKLFVLYSKMNVLGSKNDERIINKWCKNDAWKNDGRIIKNDANIVQQLTQNQCEIDWKIDAKFPVQ